MFITTLVGRLTPQNRRVEIASDRHCLPVLVKPDGSASKLETGSGLPLGIIARATYNQGSVVLAEGERIVLYTDGLSESRGEADGVLFDELMLDYVSGPAASPQDLMNRIVAAERAHRGGGSQLDDLTVLVGGFE